VGLQFVSLRDATWIQPAGIAHGALFHRVIGQGKAVGADPLNDKQVAQLVKTAAIEARVESDLAENARGTSLAGPLIRAGLASSAEVDERYVQKHIGQVSSEMTKRYQRWRDWLRVNLTKAAVPWHLAR